MTFIYLIHNTINFYYYIYIYFNKNMNYNYILIYLIYKLGYLNRINIINEEYHGWMFDLTEVGF